MHVIDFCHKMFPHSYFFFFFILLFLCVKANLQDHYSKGIPGRDGLKYPEEETTLSHIHHVEYRGKYTDYFHMLQRSTEHCPVSQLKLLKLFKELLPFPFLHSTF